MAGEVIPLGTRLRTRREELGLTQAQAARELDVARTAYRLWELEAARPSPDRWRTIAKWLGMSVTAMLLAGELIDQQYLNGYDGSTLILNNATLLAADPQALVLVLGDLNDTTGSETLAQLTGGLLTDLITTLPESERYSYVFGGQAEAIDHIVVSPALLGVLVDVDVVHGNAEIIGGASDHDPVLARFRP